MANTLDAGTAFQNSQHKKARWRHAAHRLSGYVRIDVAPTFSLRPTDTVLTMGSCFARNIERNLAELGCRVPALELSSMDTGRGSINLFTTPNIRQEIEWAEGIHARGGGVRESDCTPFAFELPDGTVIDLHLYNADPVSPARFFERRTALYRLYATAFTADCIVLTPGLTEAWFDKKHGLHVQATSFKSSLLDKERFVFDLLDYQRCLDDLLRIIDLVRKHNAGAKFLVTVSPVPLSRTFSSEDVLVANTLSKATLRAACGAAARARPLVDYFPSYEMVMLSSGDVWRDDRRHVQDHLVRRIVECMGEAYFSKQLAALEGKNARPARGALRKLRRFISAKVAARLSY